MKDLIDSSFPIVKYFESIDDCVQLDDNSKTTYTAAQVIHNDYHTVLASGIYVDA